MILGMALNLLYNLYLVQAPDPVHFSSYATGYTVKVYWDDVALAFQTDLYDTTLTIVSTPTTGPVMSSPGFVQINNFQYQYCAGTTLNYFTIDLNVYPYAIRNQVANSNVCQTLVCDLHIVNTSTIAATGALNQDGSATVIATSSYGPIKYKLNASQFDYASDGQLSNVFSSLIPGTYSFVAIDSFLCKKIGVFVIPNTDTYIERWRNDFLELKTTATHRLSIEDRLYVGAVTIVKMDISAVQVFWRGEASEDSFVPVITSQLTASLLSETDGQFLDLFTYDEKRFKIKKYINTGSGFILQWIGFVSPMLYNEQYVMTTNYPVSILGTDCLGNVSKFEFNNDQGSYFTSRISYMMAISTILRKTGLQLNIKESVNLFETTMAQTASDSPLMQCTIDPDVYKNADGTFQDCLTVLRSLIANLGCRLYMDNGIWNIDLIEQKSATSIAYRIFTYLGIYSSNSTYDPTINMTNALASNRIVPSGQSLFMNITQNYGKFNFINDLHIVNNMVSGGDMEVLDNTGSNPTFKGWSIDVSNGAGVSYGLEKLDKPNKGSNFAAFFDFRSSPRYITNSLGTHIVLQSDPFTFAFTETFKMVLSFDVFTRPQYTDTHIFIDYEVHMGSSYLENEGPGQDGRRQLYTSTVALLGSGTGVFSTSPPIDYSHSPEYNRVFITEHLTWKTIQIEFFGSNTYVVGTGYVKLRIWGNPDFDYPALTGAGSSLVNAITADGRLLAQSTKARVFDTPVIRWYVLNAGTDATSSPDKIRPADFNAVTNPVFWKLDKTTATIGINNWLSSILIDNVQLIYLPGTPLNNFIGGPPVDNITYVQITNAAIFDGLSKTFNHGDIPPTDLNYKYIAKGHLELINGTPTINWKRSYMSTDNNPLVQLLLNMYMGQFQAPKNKLTGTFLYDLPVGFSNVFYDLRTLKRYMPNSITLNYADSSMNAEMLELKTGISSPAPDLFAFSTGFTTGFNA